MFGTIKLDHDRFRRLVEDRQREALRRHISSDRIDLPNSGQDGSVRIPVRKIAIPQISFDKRIGGVGQGTGVKGEPLFGIDEIPIRMTDIPADHEYQQVKSPLIATVIGEELELPNPLERFGGQNRSGLANQKYVGTSRTGPQSLRHRKATYREALTRSIASGIYRPELPIVIPDRGDFRFRAPRDQAPKKRAAVIAFLLDSSESMDPTINFLQQTARYADLWIQHHYPEIIRHYVHYDQFARETGEELFYCIGATNENNVGLGLSLVHKILSKYPDRDKYLIHLTDGDSMFLNITEEMRGWYDKIGREEYDADVGYTQLDARLDLRLGNPLTDLVLPECNAIFVCEAGGYLEYNYSDYLKDLARDDDLAKRLRIVNYTEMDVRQASEFLIVQTLKTWFS